MKLVDRDNLEVLITDNRSVEFLQDLFIKPCGSSRAPHHPHYYNLEETSSGEDEDTHTDGSEYPCNIHTLEIALQSLSSPFLSRLGHAHSLRILSITVPGLFTGLQDSDITTMFEPSLINPALVSHI